MHELDRGYSVSNNPWELHCAMAEPPSESCRHTLSWNVKFEHPWLHAASEHCSWMNDPDGGGVGGDGPGGEGEDPQLFITHSKA